MPEQEQVLERAKRYIFCGRNYERIDLRGYDLRGVNFTNCNFRGADLSGSDLRGALFICADLSRAVLQGCDATGADFSGADLTGAYCRGLNLTDAQCWHTCFKGALCKNVKFYRTDLTGADIARAEMLGARFDGAITTGLRNIDRAIFRWFLAPTGGKPSYDPFPGAVVLTGSITGSESFQENAGLGINGLGYRA